MVSNGDAEFSPQRKKCNNDSLLRTLALEQAYVHEVYSVLASNAEATNSPVHTHVKQFIVDEFEPGSILLDIGCGDGKYLNLNNDVVILGLEHCAQWFRNGLYKLEPNKKHLVMGDVLYLPFRDEFFDGVLCCNVLHHLSTLERRINALKEIARILKIGGKLLLTVTSGPAHLREIESQDVLIRVNKYNQHGNCFNQFSSDDDSKSYASSTSTSDSSLEMNVYDNCTSPTSSEFENCYSFVKRTLKRFSITSSIYSMKNSSLSEGSYKSRMSTTNMSLHDDLYPIELRNLDDNCSSHSSSTTGDSALSSFNRSSGTISQTSSSNIFSSSLFASIKEHLVSWKVQLANSMVWHSLETKNGAIIETNKSSSHHWPNNAEQLSHRFSLPLNFRKVENDSSSSTTPGKANYRCKNKVYAFNTTVRPMLQKFSPIGENERITDHLQLVHSVMPTTDGTEPVEQLFTAKKVSRRSAASAKSSVIQTQLNGHLTTCHHHQHPNQHQHQHQQQQHKQYLLANTRQASFDGSVNSKCKSPAYFSMPDLREWSHSSLGEKVTHASSIDSESCSLINQAYHFIPTNECSPGKAYEWDMIENMLTERSNLSECSYQHLLSESRERLLPETEIHEEDLFTIKEENEPKASDTTCSPLDSDQPNCEMDQFLADENNEEPKTLKKGDTNKFTKKLLRQRSFSADYQPEIVKFQPELPRRFSASPNIGTHRYNNNSHTPHQQQISIDSEESFVTIIPANRSTRDSFADVTNTCDNLTDFELEEEDELTGDQDLSPNEMYSLSSDEDDDACCENLFNEQFSSGDNTSVSSVLEATIKSVSKSNSQDNVHEQLPIDSSNVEFDGNENEHSERVSPPNTLHHYFHLFRSGELETIIDEHVQNLHIIDTFYNEYAASWCIVAEKIHVWTI